MDNNPENKPSQNELDLDLQDTSLNKPIKPDVLEKAKGFFGRKEYNEPTPFHIRKEPTFGTTDNTTPQSSVQTSATTSSQAAQTVVENVSATATSATTAGMATAQTNANAAQTQKVESAPAEPVKPERIIPESSSAKDSATNKVKMKNPENWAAMQKLPPKHRRLFIVLAVVVLALLGLWWLKPSSDTVNDYQQANNSNPMPIEFQSLDPNKPVENADSANIVTPQSTTSTAQADQQTNENSNSTQTAVTAQQPVAPTSNTTAPVESIKSPSDVTQALTENSTDNSTINTNKTPARDVDAERRNAEKVREAKEAHAAMLKEQQKKAREHLAAQRSNNVKAEAKTEEAKIQKVEQVKAKPAPTLVKAQTAPAKTTPPVKTTGVPVVDAKPATVHSQAPVQSASPANTVEPAKTSQSVSSKTLTVPASTSLFQVFRDNKLDIRDVNAMTKANGVGNALSNFKAGDKVQVSLNGEGRVSTMRLPTGETFIRQADGTYKYSK